MKDELELFIEGIEKEIAYAKQQPEGIELITLVGFHLLATEIQKLKDRNYLEDLSND